MNEPEYQEFDILIYIAAVFVFFASIVIFWPVQEADAATIKQTMEISWANERSLAPELSNQYDTDKLKSIGPKIEYILKDQTLQLYIWQYLTDEMNLSNECAAGIFGNMMVECGGYSFDLQPTIYSPGGYYYGICQWSTSNHHRSINGRCLNEQLQYLASTIRSEMDDYGYLSFEGATDPESAAYYFARFYERCSDPYGRGGCAREAYERFET
jgi:hypothetical protein